MSLYRILMSLTEWRILRSLGIVAHVRDYDKHTNPNR